MIPARTTADLQTAERSTLVALGQGPHFRFRPLMKTVRGRPEAVFTHRSRFVPPANWPPPLPPGSPFGLLAAWGEYPVILARELTRLGYQVQCLGVVDHADPVLADICQNLHWISPGKLGAAIRFFRRQGVERAVMAGKFHKVKLFERGFIWKNLPDWRGFLCFSRHFLLGWLDRRDDTLLGSLCAAFAQSGILFEPQTRYVPELLVKYGQLTRRGPSRAERQDIAFGWQLAKEMGRLDVGQSVAVKGRAALAIEAVEGTDQCIRRAGQLCTGGNFTVVKVAKPEQDPRFDMPAIGLGTLEAMVSAGGRVLAVEAGQTILVNQSVVLEFADRHNLVIVALDDEHASLPVPDEQQLA